MKPILLALSLTAFSVVLWPAADAFAQEEKVARGTIAAIGAASITVTVQGEPHTFTVDRRPMSRLQAEAPRCRITRPEPR